MSRVPDAAVVKALAAFESLPPHSGLFERMRAALEAVTKPSERAESVRAGLGAAAVGQEIPGAAQRGTGRLSAS